MKSIKFELDAQVRADIGKGASRRLRHANKVPGVVYGGGDKPISLTFDHNKVLHALTHEAFYSHILTLKVDSKAEKVILKAVQRNPAKPRINHLDFLRVRADQKLHMQIPLHFIGEEDAPGQKDGGVFSHLMSSVEVVCLPADLPEFIEVDVSGMEIDSTIHLTELKLPKNVELTALSQGVEGHDLPVISIHIPRIVEDVVETAEVEAEALAEETEAATEEDKDTDKNKDNA